MGVITMLQNPYCKVHEICSLYINKLFLKFFVLALYTLLCLALYTLTSDTGIINSQYSVSRTIKILGFLHVN